jgi:hypothetical protein
VGVTIDIGIHLFSKSWSSPHKILGKLIRLINSMRLKCKEFLNYGFINKNFSVLHFQSFVTLLETMKKITILLAAILIVKQFLTAGLNY